MARGEDRLAKCGVGWGVPGRMRLRTPKTDKEARGAAGEQTAMTTLEPYSRPMPRAL